MDVNNWCAVILAGGAGERLKPLTSKIPKPMVAVTNKPMVDYAIDHLRYAGIKKIIVVVRHMGEFLRDYLEQTWPQEKLGETELIIPQVDSLGTADAIRKTAELIDTPHFVVSMADIVTNLPILDMMAFHEAKGGVGTISMKSMEFPQLYGVVLLDKEKRIYLFLEKPKPQELYLSSLAQRTDLFLHTNIINTGIYCFEHEMVDILLRTNLMDFGAEVFPYLLDAGYPLFGFVADYYWLDLGNPLTYKWGNWDLLRRYGWPVMPDGFEDGPKQIWTKGDIVCGNNVFFGSQCAFGNSVHLDNNVQVKNLSVLGSGVKVGEGTIIEKSIIWDNVQIGKNCKILDSIICNDTTLQDDVELDNHVVIGPNCSIPKGKKMNNTTIKEDTAVE
ncbi:MAG TPA: NDP-sugar synthase [Candidatus Lokiarchaeia archaeon]|nr:NDP-sugar synthase [Candidatus Lokiarchaeia archaeon]